MKRFIAAILALSLCVSLTACGSSSSETAAKDYTTIIMESRSDDLNQIARMKNRRSP